MSTNLGDMEAFAQNFVKNYFEVFNNPEQKEMLRNLYTPESMLTYQTDQLQGVDKIFEKFQSLQPIPYHINDVKIQPCDMQKGSVLILVTGFYQTDNTQNPLPFARVFNVIPSNNIIINDLFLLV